MNAFVAPDPGPLDPPSSRPRAGVLGGEVLSFAFRPADGIAVIPMGPVISAHAGAPAHPVVPAHSVIPVHPIVPVHPVVPVHSVGPTHSVGPAHPVIPADAGISSPSSAEPSSPPVEPVETPLVTPHTELHWAFYADDEPALTPPWASLAVCPDVVFDDGSRLSEGIQGRSPAIDRYGFPVTSSDQFAARWSLPQQWNADSVSLAPWAGRRIVAIEMVLGDDSLIADAAPATWPGAGSRSCCDKRRKRRVRRPNGSTPGGAPTPGRGSRAATPFRPSRTRTVSSSSPRHGRRRHPLAVLLGRPRRVRRTPAGGPADLAPTQPVDRRPRGAAVHPPGLARR